MIFGYVKGGFKMSKNSRKDTWTFDEDKILGETVIKIVSSGGTQLEAFQETANKVGRTSSAVGFRWNSVVRKQYAQQLVTAKKDGKKNRPKKYTPEIAKLNNEVTKKEIRLTAAKDDAVSIDDQQNKYDTDLENFVSNYKKTIKENQQLKERISTVEKVNESLENSLHSLRSELGLKDEDFPKLVKVIKELKALFQENQSRAV